MLYRLCFHNTCATMVVIKKFRGRLAAARTGTKDNNTMPVAKMKGAKKKCDDLFSLIIRSAGECERCGVKCRCPNFPKSHTTSCKLTTSHIVGRKYSATRTDLTNAQCLCFSCHRRFTDWPREFSHWLTDTIGTEVYDLLKQKAEAVTKMDWEVEYVRLLEVAKEAGIK